MRLEIRYSTNLVLILHENSPNMEGKIFKDSIEITVSEELKLFIRSMASSYHFVFQQEKYDFVQRAMQIDLVDLNGVAQLAQRFAAQRAKGEDGIVQRGDLFAVYHDGDGVPKLLARRGRRL
ncbi:MAG: hypothetical protein IPO63_12020 [Bacteroidetes bacterium]|nr:hypothetical protein [Bacteroidota bacterium]